MARIKSAWEIALEKTQDIEIDETKYRTDKLTKEGMALAKQVIAEALRKKGMSEAEIAEVTGLSEKKETLK